MAAAASAAGAAVGGGTRAEGIFYRVGTDAAKFSECLDPDGKLRHPYGKLLQAVVEDGDNARFKEAVDASPMPGFLKYILYTLVKPGDVGWGWADEHLSDHRVELVKAAQLVMNPLALLQHAVNEEFDADHMRMIIDHLEDHLPGSKDRILGLFWEKGGKVMDGDTNWSWNHLGKEDKARPAFQQTLTELFGDGDWGEQYQAMRETLSAGFVKRKRVEGEGIFRMNGCTDKLEARAIPECRAIGVRDPFTFGYYSITPDGNFINPYYPKLSVRLPDMSRKILPISIRELLMEEAVSSVKVFADVVPVPSLAIRAMLQGEENRGEVSIYSHPIVHNEAVGDAYDRKKFPRMGIFAADGVVPLESPHGPLPFDRLEAREVYLHPVAGHVVQSPKNAMFYCGDGKAEFWTVMVMDEGSEKMGTHRKIALVAQHVLSTEEVDFDGIRTVEELCHLDLCPSILRDLS